MPDALLPACSFEHQVGEGDWDFKSRTFTPSTCVPREITPEDARKCLANRSLAFLGDSMVRDLGMAVASFLGGLSNVSEVESSIFGSRTSNSIADRWEARHPGRKGLFRTLRTGDLMRRVYRNACVTGSRTVDL
jgi:hypothetical protein